MQWPEIDFRLTPDNGHSEAHTGLPLLTHCRPRSIAFDRIRGEAAAGPIDTVFGIEFAVDAHFGSPALRRAERMRSL